MPNMHALLLTDVVESTRLTEQLGDEAMTELWTAHDRVARDLLPVWRGREIDKTDGMLLLFDGVHDAVGYALAYHRALAARGLPFKARAGIHVGPVSLRPNPPDDVARGAKPVEVGGLALPIAARVMSVALGAQTLLSADARLALGVAPQRVVSHGHWRMQGVTDPIELFEVGESGTAPFAAPPDGAKIYRVVRQGDLWQPVREVRHSVPAERDSFVGRQEPLRLLAQKFEGGARLVSVLGIGGTGKTRLVTRFAWTVLGDYPGGVWFCDLSQARTVDGIHFAVAQGLDVPLGKTDPLVQITHAIAGRGKCLVILDNFEQVARHAEETLGRWLDRAPMAQFIVTTREVLGIVGEETMALAPLPMPDAAALFLRRAESAGQGHSPSADDLLAIDQLVKVLDGLPLAIELAAARVRFISARALLARMHERFNVLMSRSGRNDRQATLRAAFDWSWELLSDTERAGLAQLSVFDGGFTLESAAAVLDLGSTGTPPLGSSEVIESLVDKSFVRRASHTHFDLLESVREYAAEHLGSDGRFAGSGAAAVGAARARHWRYFAGLDERSAAANRAVEANNLVAACRRATAANDADAAAGALLNAWAALRLTGPLRIGLELAEQVHGLAGLSASQRASVYWVAGSVLEQTGEIARAHKHLLDGLAVAGQGGRHAMRTRLMLALGSCEMVAGETETALATISEAHRLAVLESDLPTQAAALNKLGRVMDEQGRLPEARAYYSAALLVARSLADRGLEGALLGNLGGLLHDLGDLGSARQHYEQALELTHEVGDRRWEGNARCNLGLLHLDEGRCDLAQREFEVSLAIAAETGHARLGYTVQCNIGLCLMEQGQFEDATERLDTALAAATDADDRRSQSQFLGYLALLAARRGRLEAARQSLEHARRLHSAAADRLGSSVLECHCAEIETRAGNFGEARAALARAQAMAEELNAGPTSELGRRVAAASGIVGSTSS